MDVEKSHECCMHMHSSLITESNVLIAAIATTSIVSEGTDYSTSAVAYSIDAETTKTAFIEHTTLCQEG